MLTRGFLRTSHPSDGPDEVWIPGRRGRSPVTRSAEWGTVAPGAVLPVVLDTDRPTTAVLLDAPVRGTAAPPLTAPSDVEALCPAPTVHALLEAVRVDGRGVFPEEGPGERLTDLQWAVALRMGQLSLFEARRIAALGVGDGVHALRERLETVGPPGSGLTFSPGTVHRALDHLSGIALSPTQRAHVLAAFAAVIQVERTGVRRLVLRKADPEDVRSALAPFVAVCGPIPGVDVAPASAPPVAGPPDVAAPPEWVLRAAPEAVDGRAATTLRLDTGGDGPPPLAVGDELAVVARQGVTLAGVAVGAGCTVHRVEIVNPPTRRGSTVRVAPAVPSHEWARVRVLPVRWCREHLAAHPEAGARTVDNRPAQAYRRPAPGLLVGAAGPSRPAAPRRSWFRRRARAAAPAGPTGPAPEVVLWRAAAAEHDRVLAAYLPYETDPALILSYPAVTDVGEQPTADFHDALARAQALRPETGPVGPEQADAYHRAVTEAARRWSVCEDHGRRTGHGRLSAPDAADLDRAAKLLRHAAGAATELERAAYLDRARTLVEDIAGRATVRLGPGARRRLGGFAVAELPGPGSGGDQREARGAP